MSQKCVGTQTETPYVLCWQVWCSTLQAHVSHYDQFKSKPGHWLLWHFEGPYYFNFDHEDEWSKIFWSQKLIAKRQNVTFRRHESSTWYCIQYKHYHENLNIHYPLLYCLLVLSYHGKIQISSAVPCTKPAYVIAHCTLWCACHTYLHHYAMAVNGNSNITISGSETCVNWSTVQQPNQQPRFIFIYNSSCMQHDFSFITLLIHQCHTHLKCIHTV
jgi:hypothetical protein